MKKQNEKSAELREEELEQVTGGAKIDKKMRVMLDTVGYVAEAVGVVAASPMEAPVQSAQNEDEIAVLDPFSVR